METLAAINQRISANKFDTSQTLDREIIEEIISLACQAPSSFNIQHWRFVVVTESEAKERLKGAAFGQPKVSEAAATIIVLGDLKAHEHLAEALEPSVQQGILPAPVRDQFVTMAQGMYANPQASRDEAIRSGSLAGMALMLAATGKGLATGPMIGFDPQAVCREFSITERYIPVMLITLGTAVSGNWPRKPRLPLSKVLAWESGKSFPA